MGFLKWWRSGILFVVSVLMTLPFPLDAAPTDIAIYDKGNRRVEKAAILNQITLKVGQTYSQKQVRESIENIYNLGFFDDIVVDAQVSNGSYRLNFHVREKPAIREIKYEGYKKVDLSDIKDVVEIKAYSILDLNKIRASKEKIVKMYEQKGFFLAQVTHRLEQDEKENEVELIFKIDEFDKVKIRKINLIGNQKISNDELKGVLATKEKGFFSWLTKSDNYQEDLFKGDLENLAYYYHTKGFVQVKIDPPIVTVSPDKKWIDIMVTIFEGDIFNVGAIQYDGELIFSKRELEKDRLILPQVQFNREDLRKEVLRLADLYKDEGYAYANVNVRSNVREKEKKVDLTFDFEKGQKVYIGKIRIAGNSNTRDKVIRREMRIHEGDLYNETRLRNSIDRVRALGYFGEVNLTKPQGESLNEMDLNIAVTERSTGALTLGAGWSSVDKVIANAQLSHNNLFGRGHNISLNAQLSGRSNRFTLSFTEPYTLDSLWSSGFDSYKTETDTEDFTELKTGGDVRVGHPIGEFMDVYGTYKLENLELDNVDENSRGLIVADGLVSSVIGTLILDKRNNRFEPTQGYFDRLMTEYAGLGGDNHFSKTIFNTRYYYPLSFGGVFRVNGEAGFLTRTTSEEIPTTERFILGGVGSLRGFKPFSLGPEKVGSQGEPVLIGGTRELFANIEYEVGILPAMGVKGVLFYDVGSSFIGSRIGQVRQDVGFGARWFSPFGPIRVEVGFPIKPEAGEKKSVVQFAITPPF